MANQVEKQQAEEQVAVATEATTASDVKAMKRGTIIQAVKAIAVLVCICLVCVVLLALCNDIFYISDEERFNRSMQKIYPELDLSTVKTVELNSEFTKNATYGEIKSVVTDGKVYIIEALGINGYQSGTVTLYVIVGSDAKIISWAVKEHTNQSYIDQVPAKAGTTWYHGMDVSNALEKVQTGSTLKETPIAIGNAVNMAAYYCRSALGVGKNPEADAQKAIIALLGDGYAAYELTTAAILNSKIDATNSVKDTFKIADDEISYIMYADGDNGFVKAYVYGQDADTQKIVAFAGNEVKLSANLTADDEFVTTVTTLNSKLNVVKSGSYTGFGYVLSVDTSAGTVYSVSGIQFKTTPSTYVLNVTVADGVVTAIEVKTDGYEAGISHDDANKLVTSLVGATLENIADKYSDKVSGATQSADLIRIAVETALLDYNANHASNN